MNRVEKWNKDKWATKVEEFEDRVEAMDNKLNECEALSKKAEVLNKVIKAKEEFAEANQQRKERWHEGTQTPEDEYIKELSKTKDFSEILSYIEEQGETEFDTFDYEEVQLYHEYIAVKYGIDNPVLKDAEALACHYCGKKVTIDKVGIVNNSRWVGYEGYHTEGVCSDCMIKHKDEVNEEYGLE